jgi:hypothetical protein
MIASELETERFVGKFHVAKNNLFPSTPNGRNEINEFIDGFGRVWIKAVLAVESVLSQSAGIAPFNAPLDSSFGQADGNLVHDFNEIGCIHRP